MKTFGLVALFAIVSSISAAQSDQLNLEKYWKLRHRFVEKYVKIGPHQGESLPAGALVPDACIDNVANDGTDPEKWQYTEYGKMHWGDGMIRHGHYLCLLSTEYALKKKYGIELTGTLNELYYALNAINRVDRVAEVALNSAYGTSYTESLNGFYLREDVPEDFCQNWSNDPLNFGCTNSAYYENNNVAKLSDPEKGWYLKPTTSYQNVPSMDQMSSLMIGLSMVHKLVDDIYVQPQQDDQGFKLVTETQNIVQRIVTYASERNWEIIDVNGWPVANGGGDIGFAAYPYAIAASRITGNSFDSYEPYFIRHITRYHPQFNSLQHCITGFGVSGQEDKQAIACEDLQPSIFKPILSIMQHRLQSGAIPGDLNNACNSTYLDWSFGGKSHSIKLSKPIWKNKLLNFSSNLRLALNGDASGIFSGGASRNRVIFFNLGVTAGFWNSNRAHFFGNKTANRELELINAVLHDHTPRMSKDFYKQYLDGMPISGPFNLVGKSWTSNPEGPWYITKLGAENGWNFVYRWRHSMEEEATREGFYSGLDYMVYHNLYYLLFTDELPSYEDSYRCFCDESLPQIASEKRDEELQEAYQKLNSKLKHLPVNSENAFASTFNTVVNRYAVNGQFPEYSSLSITPPKFQTENVSVRRKGEVVINTTLIICEGKQLTLSPSSSLQLKQGKLIAKPSSRIEMNGVLTLHANTELKLMDGAKLNLNRGAKLIIEKGANIDAKALESIQRMPQSSIVCEDEELKAKIMKITKHIEQ